MLVSQPLDESDNTIRFEADVHDRDVRIQRRNRRLGGPHGWQRRIDEEIGFRVEPNRELVDQNSTVIDHQDAKGWHRESPLGTVDTWCCSSLVSFRRNSSRVASSMSRVAPAVVPRIDYEWNVGCALTRCRKSPPACQ